MAMSGLTPCCLVVMLLLSLPSTLTIFLPGGSGSFGVNNRPPSSSYGRTSQPIVSPPSYGPPTSSSSYGSPQTSFGGGGLPDISGIFRQKIGLKQGILGAILGLKQGILGPILGIKRGLLAPLLGVKTAKLGAVRGILDQKIRLLGGFSGQQQQYSGSGYQKPSYNG